MVDAESSVVSDPADGDGDNQRDKTEKAGGCPPPEDSRQLFGARLRSLRESLNRSERDIIHLTRISPPFIKALEEGHFDLLPGEVFGRGFIKSICKVLEVNPGPLLEEYNACWGQCQAKPRSDRPSRRFVRQKAHSEHRSRLPVPFMNYFSGRGLFFWVACPFGLVSLVAFSVWFSSSQRNAPGYGSGTEAPSAILSPPAARSFRGSGQQAEKKAEAGSLLQESPVQMADDIAPPSQDDGSDGRGPLEHQANALLPAQEQPSGVFDSSGRAQALAEGGNPTQPPAGAEEGGRLLILVLEDVEIKLTVDGELWQQRSWTRGSHTVGFRENAELFASDPSKIRVFFNGGALGQEGQSLPERHLSFFTGSGSDKNI